MAQVEIYKLKKTAPPNVREYSIFDYMRDGKSPDPMYYVREWAGEMHGTLPLTIPGRLMLEPPAGYHGGNITNGDIAVVSGTPYFMDKLSGSKFVEIEFDAAAVRDAVHVNHGWFVDVRGAEAISDTLSYVCDDLGIPVGYLGEQKRGGIYNDNRPFLPGSSVGDHLRFLHPEFMKGEEARAFTSLLSELTESERWEDIFDYLRDRYPVNQSDLEAAREQYAPELLLPEELRPLLKVIPTDADKSELDYLTAKISGMNETGRKTFYAVIDAEWHCGSVAEIINLTENLEHFDLEPAFTESQYGKFRLDNDWDICEAAIRRLEKSEDASDRFLVKYITLLNRCADDETYGHHAAKDDGGVFTKYGYITQGRSLDEKYLGIQNIPADYHVTEPPAAETEREAIMVCNVDLPALLLEMHALGGDYMRDARNNLQTLTGGGTDFLVMMNNASLVVTPADLAFRNGTSEHELWTALGGEPDVSTFVMSITDRGEGRVTGNLYEVALEALQYYIQNNSIDSGYPDAESKLAMFLDVLRWAVEENRSAVPTGLFLQQLNEPYMARSKAPQPDWYRVSPEAAREYLAQGGRFIFKAYPEPPALLTPIDAAKAGLWTGGKYEFFVRHDTRENLERLAKRVAGEMLRQAERGEHKKSRDTEH